MSNVSGDWYPDSLPRQREMYAAILANIDQYATVLGLSVSQVQRLKDIANTFIAAYDAQVLNKAASKAFTSWFGIILHGNEDSTNMTMPMQPTFVNAVLPVGTFLDIIEEMRGLRRYMSGQKGWNDEVADALKMNTPDHSDDDDGEAPTLKIVETMGSQVTVEWKKGDATAMEFQYLKFGTTLWQPLKTATNSPTQLDIPLTTPGAPEKFQIRAIRQRKDRRTGDWSQPYLVTVG